MVFWGSLLLFLGNVCWFGSSTSPPNKSGNTCSMVVGMWFKATKPLSWLSSDSKINSLSVAYVCGSWSDVRRSQQHRNKLPSNTSRGFKEQAKKSNASRNIQITNPIRKMVSSLIRIVMIMIMMMMEEGLYYGLCSHDVILINNS